MSTKWIDLSGLRIFKELQDSQNDNKYALKEDIPSIEDLDVSSLATKEELGAGLSSKQDTLVSGTNIKTINGQSVLGEGDILINSTPTDEELYELSITLVDSNPGRGHYNDYIVLTTEEVDAILGSDKFVINLGGDDVIFYKYERYSDEESAYSAFSNNNQIIFYCYKNSWSDEHEASIYTNYHYSPYKASEYNHRLYDDLYGIDGDIVVSVSDPAYGNVPCVLTETEDGFALSYVYSAVIDGNDSIVKGKLTVDSNNNIDHTYDIITNANLLDLTDINSNSGTTYEYISNHLNNPIYVKDSGWDYSSDQKNSKYDMIAPATVTSYDKYTYLGVTYNNCFIIEYAFNGYMRHVIACADRTIKSPRRTYILRLTEPLPQVGSSISGSWGDSNNVGSADQINIVYDNGSHTSLMSVFVDKQYQIQETIEALFLGGFDGYTNTQTYYRLTSSSGRWGISAYEVALGSGAELTSESIIEALGYTPQESITDLENIRAGAALGSTALQAHQDISGKLDKTEAESTYLTKNDAASGYASKTDLDAKQNTITDLNDIRTNANKSSQAMQMVENLTAVVNENEEVAARAISDIYAKLETTPGDSGSDTSNSPVGGAMPTLHLDIAFESIEDYSEISISSTQEAVSQIQNKPFIFVEFSDGYKFVAEAKTSYYAVDAFDLAKAMYIYPEELDDGSYVVNMISSRTFHPSIVNRENAIVHTYMSSMGGSIPGYMQESAFTLNSISQHVLGNEIVYHTYEDDKLVVHKLKKDAEGNQIEHTYNVSPGFKYDDNISTETSYTLNHMECLTWQGSQLTVNFGNAPQDVLGEYYLIIKSNSTAPTIIMPSSVKWADGLSDVIDGVFAPQPNYEYHIHITQKKYATYLKYTA